MVNFTDFTQAPLQQSPFADLMANVMKGYQAQKIPEQMRLDRQQKEQLIQQLLLGNEAAKVENEFLRPRLTDEQAQRRLQNEFQTNVNRYQVPQIQLDMLAKQLANQGAEIGNKQQSNILQFQPQSLEAELESKLADIAYKNAKAQSEMQKYNQPIQTEEDKAYAKEIGKNKAKFLKENTDKITAAGNAQLHLENLSQLMEQPSFSNAVGPLDKWTGGILGFPETREMRGELQSATGQLLAEFSRMFAGATSNKELQFYQSIKPSLSDTQSAFRGKVNGLKRLNDALMRRHQLIGEYVKSGMDENKAIQQAIKEVPIMPIMQAVKANKATGNYSIDTKLYRVRNKNTGVIEEVTESEARKRGVLK